VNEQIYNINKEIKEKGDIFRSEQLSDEKYSSDLQNRITNLEAWSYNNTLLNAKDGFYITYKYQAQLISSIEINFDTKSTITTYADNNQPFFIARHPCEVMWVAESHTVKGTDAGAVTLNIEKLTGTQAPGAGVEILGTAFDMKGTIDTVVQKEGKDLTVNRQLKNGERLCVKFTGTKTALAGVCLTVYLKYLTRGHYK